MQAGPLPGGLDRPFLYGAAPPFEDLHGAGLSLSIRPAARADAALILSLVGELADTSVSRMRSMPRRPRLAGHCLSAEPARVRRHCRMDREPAGFALWFYNFLTFRGRHGIHLEDVFVRPDLRSVGYRHGAPCRSRERCLAEDLARLEWWVLDWNEPALMVSTFRSAQFAMDGWTKNRLDGDGRGASRGSHEAPRMTLPLVIVVAAAENGVIVWTTSLYGGSRTDLRRFRS